MSYNYNLPDAAGNPVIHETVNNSIIIIGANGSGKSKLGAWMEQRDINKIHRVGAQRSLNFGEYIQLKTSEQANKQLFYGNETHVNNKNGYRWNNGNTTTLLSDFEYVLSALVAKNNLQKDDFVSTCKQCDKEGRLHPIVPDMVIDMFKSIWQEVFPQRDIEFRDSKVVAIFNDEVDDTANKIPYKGKEMSDGERTVLYIIAQCLCLPENITIIVDEPEIHLHRSIMNKLWSAIEKKRDDCLFVYITHDTQFAANHKQAKKIWVRSYDGRLWDIEEVKESSLPEELLLNILGNRKNVIFVEGDANSFDTKLFSLVYEDYYVVPCGSCSNVIMQTKSMRSNTQLHHLQCFGIIDRDFRSEYEINKYKQDNVFTLSVAEVENLFLVEELLLAVNSILALDNIDAVEEVKRYILSDRYRNQKDRQIINSIIAELKYKFSEVAISGKGEDEILQSINSFYSDISVEEIKTSKNGIFKNDIEYKEVLRIFNEKSLCNCIGHFFGMLNKEYCNFILRQFNTDNADKIKKAIIPYLPEEIKA